MVPVDRRSATTRTASSTGPTARPTYFAADIGYVTEKFSRGFDHLIYIWGVDHHGTIARNKNAAEAMGYDPRRGPGAAHGWVPLRRATARRSRCRSGPATFVTLDDLLDEVGDDAARWFFASRGAHVDIDFDIELAKQQSSENPVYYVQYAHARIASILRKAAEAGLAPAADVAGLLAGEPEAALVRASRGCPRSSRTRSPPRRRRAITAYATELATQFHAFYRDARVVDPDAAGAVGEAARARRWRRRITLANALGLLGISAPESM